MNDIREIVTKAVIGKGKKRFKITSPLNDLRSPVPADRIRAGGRRQPDILLCRLGQDRSSERMT